MKRYSIIYLIAAIGMAGCAVEREESGNEDSIFEFESWMQANYPEVLADESKRTSLGAYILPYKEEVSGKAEEDKGEAVDNAEYIRVQYVSSTLQGQVTASSDSSSAKQFGNFDKTYYYGPQIWRLESLNAGVEDILKGMKVGETRKAAIPGWLMTSKRYASEQEYKDNVSGSHAIYNVSVEEIIPTDEEKGNDLAVWQTKVIEGYIAKYNKEGYPDPLFDDGWKFNSEMTDTSSVGQDKDKHGKTGSVYGFYYDNGKEIDKKDSVAFENKDTTILINYTGRRIIKVGEKDGKTIYDEQIFDTTDEFVAKKAGIYSPGKKYEPVEITWGESANEIMMGSGTVITGFSKMLWNMQFKHKEWEKEETDEDMTSPSRRAVAIFYSDYGYQAKGSGNLIPAYSPLMFEVEIIKEPKKEEDKE